MCGAAAACKWTLNVFVVLTGRKERSLSVSHRLCLTPLICQLKCRAGRAQPAADFSLLVLVLKFCQLQEKRLYVSIWSVLTSAGGTQINIGMLTPLCLSEGGLSS